MSDASPSPEGGPPEFDLRRALELAGWRFTRQRAAVFAHLQAVECHPSAEDVFRAVRRQLPTLSLATVYKALEALVDAGLAVKIADADGPTRYDGRIEPHYHCRCLNTGRLRDVPVSFDPQLLTKLDPGLIEALRREGFHVTHYRLELLGQFENGA